MAICRAGGLVGALSGRVGGVVFRSQRVGQVVASPGWAADKASAAQLEARSRRAFVVAGWRGLTDDVRQAWRTFAQSRPVVNRLGVSRAISGWQSYSSYAGVVFGSEPPVGVEPPQRMDMIMPGSVVGAWFTGGPLGLTVQGAPWPDEGVEEAFYVQRMAAVSAVAPHRRVVRVGGFSKGSAGEDLKNIAPELAASLVDGERVLVGARWWREEGLPGPKFWAPVVVGAAPVSIDDFERAALSYYTGDVETFSLCLDPVYEGEVSLKGAIGAGAAEVKSIGSSSGANFYPVRGHQVSWRVRLDGNELQARVQFARSDADNMYYVQLVRASLTVALRRIIGGVGVLICSFVASSLPVGEWLRVVVDWGPGSAMAVEAFNAVGASLGSAAGSDASWDVGGVGFQLNSAVGVATNAYWDAVEVSGAAAA